MASPSPSASNKDIPSAAAAAAAPPPSSTQYSSRPSPPLPPPSRQSAQSRFSNYSNPASISIPDQSSRKRNHKHHRKPPRPANQSRRNIDDDFQDLFINPMSSTFSHSPSSSSSSSLRNLSSRKGRTSITHLLDFSRPLTYEEIHNHSQRLSTTPRRKGPTYYSRGYLPADKARYVHGNYRFIVFPTHSYSAQASNADVHIDWSDVLQVIASAQYQSTACPICLSEPVAPRMSRCGHVFCLPCLIRYMHSNDDLAAVTFNNASTNHPPPQTLPEKKQKWKKCPICEDSIYLTHARPVRFYSAAAAGGDAGNNNNNNSNNTATVMPSEGSDVVLRLVKRFPSETLALPCDTANQYSDNHSDSTHDIPWYQAGDIADFARIMKGGRSYMLQQYESELEALKKQQQEDELYFGDDTTWIKKAMANINVAVEVVKGVADPPAPEERHSGEKMKEVKEKEPSEGVPEHHGVGHAMEPARIDSLTSDMGELESSATDAVPGTGARTSPQSSGDPSKTATINRPTAAPAVAAAAPSQHSPSQPYYFYQALPHFYLSPLDIRILRAAFGSYESFPAALLTRIEHISTGHIIDEDLRKRTKYLSHLPFGCEVAFLECDWSDIVGKKVLEGFDAEIRKRRKRNWEKRVAEDREKMKAEKREEKLWATTTRSGNVLEESINSVRRPFTEVDFPMGLASADSAAAAAENDARGDTEISDFSTTTAGSSSASLLPHGQQKTVWGTLALSPSEPNDIPSPPKDDGWLKDWEQDMKLQKRMLSGASGLQEHELGESGENKKGGAGGKKKKKGKKITLMSTTARRGA
ncbi:hypothetical protein KEM54_000823 [Ascosphaera aggregata]|nr:hypothetical protein KEM54_000823 [Ascosphaera aggregata]